MPVFERLEFPKKYPIPHWIKYCVLLAILFGFLMHNCSQNQLDREIQISGIAIPEYSRVHVEVEYTISNNSRIDRDVWLLLRVFDNRDEVVGSALFIVNTEAGQTKPMRKILYKLEKDLEGDVTPVKAVFEIYKRKVL